MKECKQGTHPICESSDSKLAVCVCWCAECKESHQDMPIKVTGLIESAAAAKARNSKEVTARNKALYELYSYHADSLDRLRKDIETIIKGSIFSERGLDDGTISQLDYATHMHTFHADKVNAAWESYESHCIRYEIETRG